MKKQTGMSMRWYGVKTAYRILASGRPNAMDRSYQKDTSAIEERIVLFRARTPAEAAGKAKREAVVYAKGLRHKNAYGENIRWKFLGKCEVYDTSDDPGNKIEVFSSVMLAKDRISDKDALRQVFGQPEGRSAFKLRFRFLDWEITQWLVEKLKSAPNKAL